PMCSGRDPLVIVRPGAPRRAVYYLKGLCRSWSFRLPQLFPVGVATAMSLDQFDAAIRPTTSNSMWRTERKYLRKIFWLRRWMLNHHEHWSFDHIIPNLRKASQALIPP